MAVSFTMADLEATFAFAKASGVITFGKLQVSFSFASL